MKTTIRPSVPAMFASGLLLGALGSASADSPFPTPPEGGLPACKTELFACETELSACDEELAACVEEPRIIFPGDGYTGAQLSYTDNGDGTFTDINTGLMWEIKTNDESIHDVDNRYTWTNSVLIDPDDTDPDGSAFTEFLAPLNNPESPFAGHTDWRLPTVKELQSLVDYSTSAPDAVLPGEVADFYYWSSTSHASIDYYAWNVSFNQGQVIYPSGFQMYFHKGSGLAVRAVRGGE